MEELSKTTIVDMRDQYEEYAQAEVEQKKIILEKIVNQIETAQDWIMVYDFIFIDNVFAQDNSHESTYEQFWSRKDELKVPELVVKGWVKLMPEKKFEEVFDDLTLYPFALKEFLAALNPEQLSDFYKYVVNGPFEEFSVLVLVGILELIPSSDENGITLEQLKDLYYFSECEMVDFLKIAFGLIQSADDWLYCSRWFICHNPNCTQEQRNLLYQTIEQTDFVVELDNKLSYLFGQNKINEILHVLFYCPRPLENCLESLNQAQLVSLLKAKNLGLSNNDSLYYEKLFEFREELAKTIEITLRNF